MSAGDTAGKIKTQFQPPQSDREHSRSRTLSPGQINEVGAEAAVIDKNNFSPFKK